MFRALQLTQQEKVTQAQVIELEPEQLPAGDVRIEVHYSSLNYKDGLAITGAAPVVRQWPMVPGIDLVGQVLESADPRYQQGDRVILTGWGVGENHWGGMAQQARVKGDWLVKLPEGLHEQQSMAIGTAGLTAMLCVMALEEGGVLPKQGPIVVTGASGGVGSVSVALLGQLGYEVAAVTGRTEHDTWLRELGATTILDRVQWREPIRALDKQLWAGGIDTVGDHILAKLLSQTLYGGTVAACGLAAGSGLATTVMPFILRGVRLQGVDSVYCNRERREMAWQRLVELLPASFYQQACTEITLEQVPEFATQIIQGQIKGRIIVNPSR